jgi:hypothetical protein
MSGFNFPLLFIVVVIILVAVSLLIFSDLPVWAPFLVGFIAAVVGLLLLDLAFFLDEKRQDRNGKRFRKTKNSKKAQEEEHVIPLPRRKDYIPKAPVSLTCPSCGSGDIAVILYGQPALSDELEKALAKGQVTLGGCLVYDGAPQWVCNTCKHKF